MKSKKAISMILLLTLCLSMAIQQALAQSKTDSSAVAVSRTNLSTLPPSVPPGRRAGFSLMPSGRDMSGRIFNTTPAVLAASPPAVLGSGTIGNVSLWVGTHPSGNSILGDSIITQLNGNIGIGLTTPSSKLTVQGMIETTLGGYKFPDGTIQTTAAVSGLSMIFHNATLTGEGTSASPLGIAVPLSLSGNIPGPFAGVVEVVNTGAGFSGGIGLRVQGSGGTFAGNGINAFGGNGGNNGGRGIFALAGSGGVSGGTGVETRGGSGGTGSGGRGVDAVGGNSEMSSAGTALHGIGGSSTNGSGGGGVFAAGGDGDSFGGGGVVGLGGNAGNGLGGIGVFGSGGINSLPGIRGGTGVTGIGGGAINGAPPGLAGEFQGNVVIIGNLFATGSKNFIIDHPLDPENKYLYHAAIESSEVLNVYSGNVTTGDNGEATVTLPTWFEALNSDFRYQLTVIGTFAQAIIAEKIRHNRFTIRTNAPTVEVSWQVTGLRSDAVMRKHPFKPEEDKLELERGFYVTPELFDQPEERGIEWAHNPQMMQQMKQNRLKQIDELKRKSQSKDR
jgi:hypothetical protein